MGLWPVVLLVNEILLLMESTRSVLQEDKLLFYLHVHHTNIAGMYIVHVSMGHHSKCCKCLCNLTQCYAIGWLRKVTVYNTAIEVCIYTCSINN